MRSMIALFVIVSSQPTLADCICLNRGKEVREGQTACIKTNSGNRLAVCEKNLNVTNWKFLEEGCPTAANGATAVPKIQNAVLQLD